MVKQADRSNIPVILGALTGGLLSSSCCLLQLVLNYTSVGCAGFSVLTPYRHYFRLITGGLLGYLLYTQGANRRTLTTVLLCAGLMVSQDVLSAQNKGQIAGGLQQLVQRLSMLRPSASNSSLLQQQEKQKLPAASKTTLQVQGMRCEGCAARLRGNVAAVDGVDGCTVVFSAGRIEVWSNRTRPVLVSALLEAVKATDERYSVELVSRECFDEQEQQQQCPEQQKQQQQQQQQPGLGAGSASSPTVDEL